MLRTLNLYTLLSYKIWEITTQRLFARSKSTQISTINTSHLFPYSVDIQEIHKEANISSKGLNISLIHDFIKMYSLKIAGISNGAGVIGCQRGRASVCLQAAQRCCRAAAPPCLPSHFHLGSPGYWVLCYGYPGYILHHTLPQTWKYLGGKQADGNTRYLNICYKLFVWQDGNKGFR